MAIDINLLGKRYVELTPTGALLDTSLIAAYKAGEPELNSLTFLNFQANIEIKKLKDLQGEVLNNGNFIRWNTAQDKFIPGNILLSDIPDLDASKITTGVFNIDRIPNLPISSITGLQGELDLKEPAFLKGDLVSSTLTLTNNVGRLYGSANLSVELDINFILDAITSSLDFYRTEEFTFVASYVFELQQTPKRTKIYLFHVGTELGVLIRPPLYSTIGTTLTVNTELEAGDRILVEYFFDDPLFPNVAPSLNDVATEGNTTALPLIHAEATLNEHSATLGQTLLLFLRKDIADTKSGDLTLTDNLVVGGTISQIRSQEMTQSVRRDELALNPSQIIATAGVINDLPINQGTKVLSFTDASELTGIIMEDDYLIRIEARGVNLLIRNESILSEIDNQFFIGSDTTIQDGQIYSFVKIGGKIRSVGSVNAFTVIGTPPISNIDTGIKGQRAYDSNFVYECVDTDTWVRYAIDITSW